MRHRKGIAVDKDVDIAGAQTQVDAGVIGARIFVYNQQAKPAKAFNGLSYFPYDPKWRVSATFTPDPKRPARVFRTSRGTDKQFYRVGEAAFTFEGKAFHAAVLCQRQRSGEDRRHERLLHRRSDRQGRLWRGALCRCRKFGAFPPKTVTIDFNDAYNPNCARSAFFTCPVALDNLAIAVKAGERDPHAH